MMRKIIKWAVDGGVELTTYITVQLDCLSRRLHHYGINPNTSSSSVYLRIRFKMMNSTKRFRHNSIPILGVLPWREFHDNNTIEVCSSSHPWIGNQFFIAMQHVPEKVRDDGVHGKTWLLTMTMMSKCQQTMKHLCRVQVFHPPFNHASLAIHYSQI